MVTILEKTINNKYTKIPVWFMRQAGRYLPEYQDIYIKTKKTFFEICEDANLASDITMQPIKRFDLDAAIIFSDILVIPKFLGCNVNFIKNEGPIIKPIISYKDLVKNYKKNNLSKTINAIKITRNKLQKEKTLIGFAGAPWTIACYMIEGKSNIKFANIKKFINTNRNEFYKIIDLITEVTIEYLQEQIKAGANIVQIFDSFAGYLSSDDFSNFVIKPTKRIISKLNCHTIGFPKGAGTNYVSYAKETCVSCVSIDYSVHPKWIKNNILDIIPVQGNLDPFLLCYDINKALISTDEIISNLYKCNNSFIFNLGHGILKDTPIENVKTILSKIRSY